ncbi:MAG: ferric reductase-like transmembrane domain-containing protein [Peptococcaceae bacterium]|nr:ferric reductase-like transmembrane domain-containing protein [Peptococcaceae bacterium]
MKKGYPVLGFFAVFTILCWLATPALKEVSFLTELSQLFAALALVGFSCAFFISTRHPMLDTLFNGLDKSYTVHKWLTITSVSLVITHLITLNLGRHMGTGRTPGMTPGRTPGMTPGLEGEHLFVHLGIPSLILFVALILIALLVKKWDYQKWKTIHKIMIIPYIIGLIHYYGSSVYGSFNFETFGVWLNIMNLIGILSAIYSLFLYENIAFPFRYTITNLQTVSKGTLEITGKTTSKGIPFQPGQFTFLKVLPNRKTPSQKPFYFPSHPFTISSSPATDETSKGTIQFTIKNLGDHTATLINSLETGHELVLTASHGTFDYTKGSKNQIWIAGGIGVTPFRSFYQSNIPENVFIDFFYCYHGEEEGVYLDEMRALKKDNLRIHLIDDTKQGFLTIDMIKETISLENPVDIFFCGPKPMRESLKKNLQSSSLHVLGFHYEEFQFGR